MYVRPSGGSGLCGAGVGGRSHHEDKAGLMGMLRFIKSGASGQRKEFHGQDAEKGMIIIN